VSIGFQGTDPATDFRGAGMLGLSNLHKFSEKDACKEVFKVATDPKTEYFFCSAGLFLTMLAFDLLKKRKIRYEYWVHDTEEQLLTNFQNVYEMLFREFNKFWL
jgi:hypothetical protein